MKLRYSGLAFENNRGGCEIHVDGSVSGTIQRLTTEISNPKYIRTPEEVYNSNAYSHTL